MIFYDGIDPRQQDCFFRNYILSKMEYINQIMIINLIGFRRGGFSFPNHIYTFM